MSSDYCDIIRMEREDVEKTGVDEQSLRDGDPGKKA